MDTDKDASGICEPLKTMDEVWNWKASEVKHVTLPISSTLKKRNFAPKTMVCHDMKGGYLEDKFVHGVIKKHCFPFIHWQLVDIFVYFSHHLVTIPPCSWINAAHTNGTLILGTLITEHDIGRGNCGDIFNGLCSISDFCNQLVRIAVAHGFDGWLINIENKMQRQEVPFIEEFLRILTQRMHKAVPDSLVIWYDSVTEDGSLLWQDSLNERNKCFFDCCDGIYLNYNWKDKQLENAVKMSGSRVTDVYAGVDVFGRGTLGGGGFNTATPVQMARTFGLSVAIFAPGWTFENFEEKDCLVNSVKFWDALGRFCSPLCYNALPFNTHFCPGFGDRIYRKGKVLCPKPWYNLGIQNKQPIYSQKDGVELYTSDAYNGGGCIRLKKTEGKNTQYFKLFDTHIMLENSCTVCFIIKKSAKVKVQLVLSMSSFEKTYNLHLDDHRKDEADMDVDKSEHWLTCLPDSPEVRSNNGDNDWIKRLYELPVKDFKNHFIENIGVNVVSKMAADVYVGGLQITWKDIELNLHCEVQKLYIRDGDMIMKSIIKWNKPVEVESVDVFYEIQGKEETYLGTTAQEFYDLHLSLGARARSTLLIHIYFQRLNSLYNEKATCTLPIGKI